MADVLIMRRVRGASMAIEELHFFDADLTRAWEALKLAMETFHRSQQIQGGEATAALHALWSAFVDAYSDHRSPLLKLVDEHAGARAYLDRRAFPIEEPLPEPPSPPLKAA